MAESVPAVSLARLHHLHERLEELRDRLERGPRQIKAHQANVAKMTTAAAEAHERVLQGRKAADAKQLDLKASEERIAGWRVKLNECASNKEYQALTEQIAAAEMAGSVLEDEILDLLGRIDTLTADAGQAEEHLEKAKQELQAVTKRVTDEAEVLKADIQRLEGSLSEAEQPLPGDFRAEYRRIVKAKGAQGLASAVDSVCTGCGQKITLNMQNSLTMARPVFCQSCGAILYLGTAEE